MTESEQPPLDPQHYVFGVTALGREAYAATTLGLLHSQDEGRTWQPAFAALGLSEPLQALSVAVAAAPHETRVLVGVNGGVLLSTDSCATWAYADVREPPPAVSVVAVSPNYPRDRTLLAGTVESGVLLSTDGGHDWAEWNFGLLDPHVICLALSPTYSSAEIVFAGTESGLYLSRSGGRGWEEIGLPSGEAPVLSLAVSPEFAADRTVYAGTESGNLLCSRDGGDGWTEVGVGEFEGALNQILVDGAGLAGRLLVLHEAGARISRDGGERWAPCNWALPPGVSATAVARLSGLEPGAVVLVGCTDGAVRRLAV